MTGGDPIVAEIMEAGLAGALASYGARKAAKGASAVLGGLGKTQIGGRIKGVTRGAAALTKIEHDFQAFMGSKQGFSRAPPTEQDLLDFAQHTYGVDAHQLLRQAKAASGFGQQPETGSASAGQGQAEPEKPNPTEGGATAAAAQGGPTAAQVPPQQAAPDQQVQAEPSAGRARKPAVSPAPKVQPAAAPAAAPAQETPPAAATTAAKPARVFKDKDGKPIDMKPEDFVPDRHDSNNVQFNAPGLQLGVNDHKSSSQQRDDERLGVDNTQKATPKDPNRKPKIHGRTRIESLDFSDVSYAQILAEKETQAVNAQTVVNDKKAMKVLAGNFFKKLAHEVASTPQTFKMFMSKDRDKMQSGYGMYGMSGGANGSGYPGQGQKGAQAAGPGTTNRTDAGSIDRRYLNDVLTNVLKVNGNPLEKFEASARGVDPNVIAKALVSSLDHDVAYKILAALVATLAK